MVLSRIQFRHLDRVFKDNSVEIYAFVFTQLHFVKVLIMNVVSFIQFKNKFYKLFLLLVVSVSLSGCVYRNPDPGTEASNAISNYAGVPFSGTVAAASIPIAGATVQLYAAGVSGNGLSPSPLLMSPLTTDQQGHFSTGKYTCPLDVSVLYIVSRGGNVTPGSVSNDGSVLTTTLGRCRDITANASFVTNELTTVSSAYALAPFAAPGAVVGSSATNQLGIANAAANAGSLVNAMTGTLPGLTFPSNGTAPTTRINSLANAVNACLITAASSNACSQLYQAATGAGSVPKNTFDAILSIAQNPGRQSSTVFDASNRSMAFSPVLQSAPADWTMPVTLTGSGMSAPTSLAIDAAGKVWVANYFNVASLFTNAGVPVFSKGISGFGLNKSFGVALDANNNAWIANEQGVNDGANGFGSVTVLNSSGASLSGANGYSKGGLEYPVSVFIDTNSTAWIVDSANSHLTLLNSTDGSSSSSAGYGNTLLSSPVAVRVDSKHCGYIANQASQSIVRVAPDGSSFSSIDCCNGASGLAIDQNDNIWVTNYYGNSVSQINQNFILVAPSYKDQSINHPQGIAVDGGGSIWIANYLGRSLTKLAGSSAPVPGAALSSSLGLGSDVGLLQPYAVAIDSAGSLWVSNFGSNTITKFIGLAAPVKTPLIGPVALP